LGLGEEGNAKIANSKEKKNSEKDVTLRDIEKKKTKKFKNDVKMSEATG